MNSLVNHKKMFAIKLKKYMVHLQQFILNQDTLVQVLQMFSVQVYSLYSVYLGLLHCTDVQFVQCVRGCAVQCTGVQFVQCVPWCVREAIKQKKRINHGFLP